VQPYPPPVIPAKKPGATKFFPREQYRPVYLIQEVPAFAGMTINVGLGAQRSIVLHLRYCKIRKSAGKYLKNR
jgi:hypothetical protein